MPDRAVHASLQDVIAKLKKLYLQHKFTQIYSYTNSIKMKLRSLLFIAAAILNYCCACQKSFQTQRLKWSSLFYR